jgi:hypothetical protein
VGYLRPVDQWNEGKQAEYRERALFDKNGILKESKTKTTHISEDATVEITNKA